METLDLHDQFQELVAEMGRLRTATDLVDEASQRSKAVLDRGEDLLRACERLVDEARGGVESATSGLREEATLLQAFKGEVAEGLGAVQESLQGHAASTESALKELRADQVRGQREEADKVRETVRESSGALGSEVKAALESSAQSHSEHMERVQQAVLADSAAARRWLSEDLSGRVGLLEKQLADRLADQGTKAMAATNAVRGDVESFRKWVTWALAAVVVLQAAALAAQLLM